MSNRIANRVKMTVSGTPGTGTITLGSAVAGFQSFTAAGVSNANTVPYIIEDGAAWEIGVGTYTATGTTMSRSVTASSNSGNPINATSAAIVMISPLAADLQAGTAAGNLVRLDGSARIPAVDGSLVTNLNATQIATGTISASRLPSISLTTGVTGTLPVANGGTGLTSLTAGYIPYGNGTGAFSSGANLFFNGNLGIGTTSPSALLTVSNSGAAGLEFYVNYPGGGTGTYIQSFNRAGSAYVDTAYYANSHVFWAQGERMRIASDGSVTWGNSGSGFLMSLTSSGNLGIGTASPGTKLDVNGSFRVSGQSFFPAATWVSFGTNLTLYSDASLGLLIQAPATSDFIQFRNSSGANLARITSAGNLGIGTTSPTSVTNFGSFCVNGSSGSFINLFAAGAWVGGMETDNGAIYVESVANIPLILRTNSTERARIDANGNVIINTAAIATNATNGFLYVPTCAGTPTGTPTTYTGRSPIVVDTTNNKLYFYSGGAWRDAGP